MSSLQPFLAYMDATDDVVEARLISALDDELSHPPRTELPENAMIFSQDDPMEDISILLDGKVKLYQLMEGREVIFHSQTAGRILGLLALTRRSRAFFSCQAVTPVTLLQISFEHLERALQRNEELRIAFITVLLRSMARRSMRLVEVQTEVLTLNKRLSVERDALARTLDELRRAQALLVESEQMATLGQLSAGVAHELNNPVAAIARSANFIEEDLQQLAHELPDGAVFREMLDQALTQKPISTREQRMYRRALGDTLGDDTRAQQLVEMGIYDQSRYKALDAQLSGSTDDRIARLSRYYQIGVALRNISSCSVRIADLVKSLRSYSRSDEDATGEVDIHEGIEDTLRLFGKRLEGVEVERRFEEIPRVQCSAGELNQVWTNLISNALDAMKDEGKLIIDTSCDDVHIFVRFIDSGPGIAPENMEKIFNLRFTTRKGRVEFGLGLGLSIAQNVVNRHGGQIDVRSEPGRTEFCVRLPHTQS